MSSEKALMRRVDELIESGAENPLTARIDIGCRPLVVEYVMDLFIDGLSKTAIAGMLSAIGKGDDAALGAMVREEIERIVAAAAEQESPDPQQRYAIEAADHARDSMLDAQVDAWIEKECSPLSAQERLLAAAGRAGFGVVMTEEKGRQRGR